MSNVYMFVKVFAVCCMWLSLMFNLICSAVFLMKISLMKMSFFFLFILSNHLIVKFKGLVFIDFIRNWTERMTIDWQPVLKQSIMNMQLKAVHFIALRFRSRVRRKPKYIKKTLYPYFLHHCIHLSIHPFHPFTCPSIHPFMNSFIHLSIHATR